MLLDSSLGFAAFAEHQRWKKDLCRKLVYQVQASVSCVVNISVALFPTKQTGEGPANAVVRN